MNFTQLKERLGFYEKEIDRIWDTKFDSPEEKGRLINSLAKKRLEISYALSDLEIMSNLRDRMNLSV